MAISDQPTDPTHSPAAATPVVPAAPVTPAPEPAPARRPGRPRALPLEEQRRVIIDAARVVFAQEGYAGATIERVARHAGTARSSVYELFHGKEDLFAAVVADSAERFVRSLATSLDETRGDQLRDYVRQNFAAVFEVFERDRHSVTVLLNAERGGLEPPMRAVAETRRQVLDRLADATRVRWQGFGIEVGDAGEMLALIYFGMAEAVAVRQANDRSWDREGLIDLLTEFTLGGLYRLGRHPEVFGSTRRVGTAPKR